MIIHDDLMLYYVCWNELRSFLSNTVRDDSCDQFLIDIANDVLNLMHGIEDKFDRC